MMTAVPGAQTSSVNQNDEGGEVRRLLSQLDVTCSLVEDFLKHRAFFCLQQSLIVLRVATVWLMSAHIILDCVLGI